MGQQKRENDRWAEIMVILSCPPRAHLLSFGIPENPSCFPVELGEEKRLTLALLMQGSA